jgi:ribosomal protein S18 acetylase RimI-like enzyme
MASEYSAKGYGGALGRVHSVGWQTDVALREMEGAEVVEDVGCLVVRTRANPGYRWGNYLLLDRAPEAGDWDRWVGRYEEAFPRAGHLAFGVDDPSGAVGDAGELRALGLEAAVNAVLLAEGPQGLRAPREASVEATFRPLRSDRDWEQAIDLGIESDELADTPEVRAYLGSRMSARRAVCELGRGAWLGAFVEDEMCAGLGIFAVGSGHARLQDVETHPAHRRKGLARNLVHAAGDFAAHELEAPSLVTAADPDYHAIAMYEALGFVERERQARLERVRPGD